MTRLLSSFAACCLAVAALVLPGCGPTSPTASNPPSQSRASKEPSITRAAEQTSWDAYYLKNSRIGYGRTTIRHAMESGREVVCIEGFNHLTVKRGNDRTEQDITVTSVETTEGQLIRFECQMRMGPSPIRTVGHVNEEQLDLEVVTSGKKEATVIPWSRDWGGPFAAEQTLLRKPMQPGERRSCKALMPGFNLVADVEMSARDFALTPLPGGSRDLLRVDVLTRFPDGSHTEETRWVDRTGDTLKTYTETMELTTYRTSEAEALANAGAAELDLLSSTAVKLNRPLLNAHRTKRVRYRVSLEGRDPAGVFVTGPTQQVQSLDAHTAEVTVFAIRPGEPGGNPDAPPDPPADTDRESNNMIQSDDPAIVADAKQAASDETDPWRTAVALERYVNRTLVKKDFSQAFATAAEVARAHEGDCTEHAVFLAALARARGIPARVAIGLIYVSGQQSFGYHMWTEVYVDGRWIPIDGTLALGGIGAAHLKLAESSLQGASAYSAFLPVVEVVGRLRVEVLDAL